MNILKHSFLFILALPLFGYSQKLPSKQGQGERIPNNCKVDGKTTEWNDKLKAYNSNTETFYTIANDDKNLYVIIKATDQLVIRKIVAGSITILINQTDSKKDKGLVAITYPIFEKGNLPNVNLKNKPVVTKDSLFNSKQLDSFMNVANKEIVERSKEIKIIGSSNLEDTLVSVYNENEIKVASHFDKKISYTYELMIPFKYLGFSSMPTKIYYTIRLNGSDHAEGSSIENIPGGVRVNGNGSMADMQFIWSPTYFSGEYTLLRE